MAAKTTQYQRK